MIPTRLSTQNTRGNTASAYTEEAAMPLQQIQDGAEGTQGSHDLGNNHNPRANAPVELSDELLDKYLGGSEDTGKTAARAPATESASLDEDEEDTLPTAGEDSDLDDLINTDEEDEGEGDETDEEEDIDALLEDDEEEADGKDESEDDTFLSDFNRDKFLKKYKDNPDVMKAYKSFQADYTKAKQEFARQEKEWQGKVQEAESLKEQYESFATKLSDDQGMQDFLLQVALHRPEVFDSAYEQALSLNEDEGQKSAYLKEQKLKEREARLEREERAREQQAQLQQIQRIETLTHRAAEKLGLKGVEVELAEEMVAKAIYEHRAQNNGKGLPDDATVVAAVKAVAKRLGVDRQRIEKEAAARARREAQKNARNKAKDAKRPQPPRGGKSPSAPKAEIKPRHANEDPLDALVDSYFGG